MGTAVYVAGLLRGAAGAGTCPSPLSGAGLEERLLGGGREQVAFSGWTESPAASGRRPRGQPEPKQHVAESKFLQASFGGPRSGPVTSV